jgi:hypothetical protein
MTLTYDHWCVIQNGVALYTFAKTDTEALEQAKAHMDDPDDPIYAFGSAPGLEHGAMVLAPCTAKTSKADADRDWRVTDDGVCHVCELNE